MRTNKFLLEATSFVPIGKMRGRLWLKDILTPDFSTPSFNPGPFNARLFNHELFNPGLFNNEFLNHGVYMFMVENSGVEMSSL